MIRLLRIMSLYFLMLLSMFFSMLLKQQVVEFSVVVQMMVLMLLRRRQWVGGQLDRLMVIGIIVCRLQMKWKFSIYRLGWWCIWFSVLLLSFCQCGLCVSNWWLWWCLRKYQSWLLVQLLRKVVRIMVFSCMQLWKVRNLVSMRMVLFLKKVLRKRVKQLKFCRNCWSIIGVVK